MNYIISGRNVEVTPALRQDVKHKMKRIEKFFENHPDVDMHVTMSMERVEYVATATVNYCGHALMVEKTAKDMYSTVDKLVDALEETISKLHDKMDTIHKRQSDRSPEIAVPTSASTDISEFVTRRKLALNIMNLEGAISQMDNNSYHFLLFIDADTKKICIIYRDVAHGYFVSEIEA